MTDDQIHWFSIKPAIEAPVKTNKIPRQVPEQAWYMNPAFTILIGGILPFGAVFIELFFILTSIWLHQFYYIFGFLFLVFIILIITCAEIAIVLCYFQLCRSSAIYLFLYAGFYFFTKLQITKLVSGILYFGYMLLASFSFFVLTGTIGFCACLWFTRLIYSSLLRSTQGSTVNHVCRGQRKPMQKAVSSVAAVRRPTRRCHLPALPGDEVLVKVNELMSIETQITYSYYSLPFCRPDNLTESAPTLWQLLHGDRQQRSPYQFEMRVPKKCQIVCRVLVGEKEAKELMEKMEDEYRVNIVKHQYEAQWNGANSRLSTCDANSNRFILSSDSPPEIEVGEEIIVTYDVNFEESDIKWASRWDAYLSMTDDQARWFSIVNSPVTLIGLSVAMAMTMLRSLHRDIFRYSQLETQNEAQVETGWKLVHGDVFRPPSNPVLLCAYAGSGVQLFGLRNVVLLTWVLMGMLAGYTSSRLYKMFKSGSEWKHITMATAIQFPGFAFVIFAILNTLLQDENSSATVPPTTMCALVLLWSGIAPPLVFLGGYLGYKRPAIEPPVEINKTPRKIPKQAWYISPVFSILIGSIFPFTIVFIELFFGLIFIWYHQFYRGFGFLLITLVLLLVASAEISVAFCYYQLRSGNYKWWWRSFLTPGCSAVYLFLYATFFFFAKLSIVKPVSVMFYFGYMLVVSYAFFLLTGTIGFFSCFFFTRFIYSQRAFG
uniref:Transmembrane 9 superfamily member n=1 Tax=Oryza rufipogon TaxID=4529 RepID=A0A0E0QM88_ORYRU